MKHVILAIFILIAVQPVQASLCAMDMDMGMEHGAQHEMDTDGSHPDCCDNDKQGPSGPCDPQMHCGAAPAGVAVLDLGPDSATVPVAGLLPSFRTKPLSPSFDSPPFRPPIS
jgi:hypothetical protein